MTRNSQSMIREKWLRVFPKKIMLKQ